ncbi:uncharacterized protein [Blastocystis hominis]|uniref:Uncharacterized protein n=1 Tax=Blastocystis hominis TaxID=12968 RepID=D8M2S3_BLAHO|nr:uncharacterized protein [Blastocystis hominis]CBK22646.2 unnamed protein product [Blastocystis hominis]|eukprot:XP_012896694.1 uncharacterized protein [Blastocystis hominis]
MSRMSFSAVRIFSRRICCFVSRTFRSFSRINCSKGSSPSPSACSGCASLAANSARELLLQRRARFGHRPARSARQKEKKARNRLRSVRS